MNPNVWGKYQWTSIHFIALGYPSHSPPENVKDTYRRYFTEILPNILPCMTCREHLKKTLSEQHPLMPKHLEGRDALFEWTVSLHNVVNARLGKAQITLEEARDIYLYEDHLQRVMCKTQATPTISNITKGASSMASASASSMASAPSVSNWRLLIILFLLIITIILVNIYYFVIWKGCGRNLLCRLKR